MAQAYAESARLLERVFPVAFRDRLVIAEEPTGNQSLILMADLVEVPLGQPLTDSTLAAFPSIGGVVAFEPPTRSTLYLADPTQQTRLG